jgi:type VI secretion system secreted protein Hcp
MAHVDYVLKIDGIPGESEVDKHKGEIDIESFSWGATNSGTMAYGGGGGAGKVSFNDFHFVMKINKATPLLMLACATGQHIKECILTCRKAGKEQQEYLIVKFADVLISSYQTGGSGGDVIPTEQISFNFATLEMTYRPQKADGTLDSPIIKKYDLKKAKSA